MPQTLQTALQCNAERWQGPLANGLQENRKKQSARDDGNGAITRDNKKTFNLQKMYISVLSFTHCGFCFFVVCLIPSILSFFCPCSTRADAFLGQRHELLRQDED